MTGCTNGGSHGESKFVKPEHSLTQMFNTQNLREKTLGKKLELLATLTIPIRSLAFV